MMRPIVADAAAPLSGPTTALRTTAMRW